jgi:DprA winged helix domain
MKTAARETQKQTLLRHLEQFKSLFKTERACMRALLSRLPTPVCGRCGSKSTRRSADERIAICRDCGFRVSRTAGTFFDGIKKARPWLAIIWLLEHGVRFNINQLHSALEIAYSTAWEMYQRLMFVINKVMEDAEALLFDSSVVFESTFIRRSRATPAHGHPIDEQAELEKEHAAAHSDPVDDDLGQLTEEEKEVLGVLSEEPIHFDHICQALNFSVGALLATLVSLELAGFVTSLPGNRFQRIPLRTRKRSVNGSAGCDQTLGDDQNLVDKLRKLGISLINELHQGISRKYLQHYLAGFWCNLDRPRWASGKLLQTCSQTSKVSRDEILSYISPLKVKVATVASAKAYSQAG